MTTILGGTSLNTLETVTASNAVVTDNIGHTTVVSPVDTVINVGGEQDVLVGGVATNTTINGGTQQVYGTAINTVVNSGTAFVAPGGMLSSAVVNGGQIELGGGTLGNVTVNAGGKVRVDADGGALTGSLSGSGLLELAASFSLTGNQAFHGTINFLSLYTLLLDHATLTVQSIQATGTGFDAGFGILQLDHSSLEVVGNIDLSFIVGSGLIRANAIINEGVITSDGGTLELDAQIPNNESTSLLTSLLVTTGSVAQIDQAAHFSEVGIQAGGTLRLEQPNLFSGSQFDISNGGVIDLVGVQISQVSFHLMPVTSPFGGNNSSYQIDIAEPNGTVITFGNFTPPLDTVHQLPYFEIESDGAGGTNLIYRNADPLSAIVGTGNHSAISIGGLSTDYVLDTQFTSGSVTLFHGSDYQTIDNVEFLEFSDKTIFIENSDNANIARLYSAALGRAPDVYGQTGWEDIYASKISAAAKAGGVYLALAQTPIDGAPISIAAGFTLSTEFQQRYGTLDDNSFVTLLYQNVLARNPSITERDAWVSNIHHGESREMVLVGFAESTENIAKTAADWLIQI